MRAILEGRAMNFKLEFGSDKRINSTCKSLRLFDALSSAHVCIGCGHNALLVEFGASRFEQSKQNILIFAPLGLFSFQLSLHLGNHVLKHLDDFVFTVSTTLPLGLYRLSNTVLLFSDLSLDLQVTLFPLHHFHLDLIIELGEVVLQAALEVLERVIALL